MAARDSVSMEEFLAVKKELDEQKEYVAALALNMDSSFIIILGIIVFLIQGGFAFLECGSVRAKNATNILMKNMLDVFFGAIAYWLVGWPLGQSDGNSFIGYGNWASYGVSGNTYARWFFHYVFAATASTIVSGAVAERCDFMAYMIYSTLITGIIYPIPTHWVWHPQGWLAQGMTVDHDNMTYPVTYQDFAGSGTLHLLSGVCALVAAAMLGPRIGRYDENGNPQPIKGHSVPLAALGGFMLFFGFFAFNSGSTGSIAKPGDNEAIALIAVNTILAGAISASTCMLVHYVVNYIRSDTLQERHWSLLTTMNGGLSGMVSICSGVDSYHPWSAFTIGLLAAPVYMISSWSMVKMKIDDPLDAISVHASCGLLGVLIAPLFKKDTGIIFNPGKVSGMHLAWNIAGALSTIVWTTGCCLIVFGCLKWFGIFRVSREVEEKGMDVPKHGEPAYPIDSYGDGWGAIARARRASMVPDKLEKLGILSDDRKDSTVYAVDINTAEIIEVPKDMGGTIPPEARQVVYEGKETEDEPNGYAFQEVEGFRLRSRYDSEKTAL